MLDKIGPVKNPLTIIAIFAAIAEVNGTVVTSLISESNQITFVWFLIGFPTLLVILFFITLNFNHHVLYAPSDFKDEQNYFKGFRKATDIEKTEKVIREIEESSDDSKPTQQPNKDPDSENKTTSRSVVKASVPSHKDRIRYEHAESLGLKKLAKETGRTFESGVSAVFGGRKYIFDAVFKGGSLFEFIEVSFVNSPPEIFNRVTRDIDKFKKIYDLIPEQSRRKFSLTIVIVTAVEFEEEELDLWFGRTAGYVNGVPFSLDIRTYDLPSLQDQFK